MWTGGPNSRSPRFPTSKFCAPVPMFRVVERSRLFEILDAGEQRGLTLVVGSPGAGKTILLTDWLAHRPDRPAGWLNCDEADADPVRFVLAVIEATRRGCGRSELGEDARQLLSVDGQVSADVIAALADDVEGLGTPVVLVVNDFHLAGVQAAGPLGLLLEYRPPALQVAVATRVDPPLRLHRMRASGDLVEVRDHDLYFTLDETAALLSAFGLELAESELALIHERSEGWVAGLQMAAIAIQSSPDPVKAASRVELRTHTVAGYFLDEVLYRQPPEIAEFMLATSILDELSPSACTALAGEGSAAMLEQVSAAHMFVSLVDEETRTYRYHHLIKDVLQAELHTRDPGRERELHAKASAYLVDAGDVGRAARHLLQAGDPTTAAELLTERLIRDFASNPTLGSPLDLDTVQPDLYTGEPAILLPLAAELLLRGVFERGSRAFHLAQQAISRSDRSPADAALMAIVSSFYSFVTGDPEESLAHREAARQQLEISERGLGDWLDALDATAMYCHTYLARFGEARRMAELVVQSPAAGPPAAEVLCPAVISQVAYGEGNLDEAEALASRALGSARRLGFDRHYFVFTATRTGALLALERRDLTAAADLTELALSRLVTGRPIFDFLAQLDRARIWAAAGNLEGSLASLPQARAALRSDRSVLLAQADEIEARLRLGLGDPDGARRLAFALPEDRRIVVSTIIALAAGDPSEAESVLSSAPSTGTSVRSDLELRLLRATLATLRGWPRARQTVREVLVIVDRHRFVQTVLDTAPRLVDHLITDSAGYPNTEHLAVLIAAGMDARKMSKSTPGQGGLPDPLTEAELRVLEKLPQRLTYADMAADLYLSLNTVKTHLRHSYMKLGVTSRSAAVKRATALGLF